MTSRITTNGGKMATRFNLKKNGNGNGNSCQLDTAAKNKCATFLTKAKLAMYMKQGLDIKDAAKLCNVSEYQLGILRSDVEFEQLIEYCSADCEKTHINNISEAGKMGAWQASAWMLERKFPEKYAKKDTVKHQYEFKFQSFQKVILGVINGLEPHIRQLVMQKLRSANIEAELMDIQEAEYSSNNLIGQLEGN